MSPRARRRLHEGDPSKWPKKDSVGDASSRAASECVPKFVNQDDAEDGEEFDEVPDLRLIVVAASLHFVEN